MQKNLSVWLVFALGIPWFCTSEAYRSKWSKQTGEDLHEFGSLPPQYGAVSNVIGGHPSTKGAFPFMASLRQPLGVWDELDHICGGFLVSENIVVTAAHCVLAGQPPRMIKPVVQLGLYHREGGKDTNGEAFEQFNVLDVFPHPEFTPKGTEWFDKDVALLRLEGKSKAKEYAKLKEIDCVPDHACNGTAARAIGWGLTLAADPTSLSDVLLEVEMPLFDRKQCMAANGLSENWVTESMLCAGGQGKDTCQGDSGGPLLVDGEVIGIVSWGISCGPRPGFYASVPATIDWIKSKMKEIEEMQPPVPPPPPPGNVELVSQFKPTYQCSISGGGYSSLAVDGDFANTFRAKSCSRTASKWFPWWYVDLGNPRHISSLRIANLKLSFGRASPLQNFEIRVGNDRPRDSGHQNERCRNGLSLKNGEVGTFDCVGLGRYVSIRIYGLGYLSLCEVQVFAEVAPEEIVQFKDPITFRAQGGSGKERLGGLEIKTENGEAQVLSVACLTTYTGKLLKVPQNCASVLPRDVSASDVRNITLFYTNPPLRSRRLSGRDKSTVFIIDGQLWFAGSNIWRSAWNKETSSNDLTTLRSGEFFNSKGEMLVSHTVNPLSFLAKGPIQSLSISAKNQTGDLNPVQLRCAPNSSISNEDWSECQGEYIENGGLSVSELRFELKEKIRSPLLNGGDIQFYRGAVFWHGVNIWWGASIANQSIGSVDVKQTKEKELATGRLMPGVVVITKVDDRDYGIDFRRNPSPPPPPLSPDASPAGARSSAPGLAKKVPKKSGGFLVLIQIILVVALLNVFCFGLWMFLGRNYQVHHYQSIKNSYE